MAAGASGDTGKATLTTAQAVGQTVTRVTISQGQPDRLQREEPRVPPKPHAISFT